PIAERRTGYDIIGLNGVFAADHRRILLDRLRELGGDEFQWVTPSTQERSVFGIDSGLALISRLPILESHSMTYGNDSSIWKHGLLADGFAAKGAIHARLGLPGPDTHGGFVDVFVTHLESQDPDVREEQYPKLAEFVRAHSDPGQPALLLGDLNTVGNPAEMHDPGSQYHRMHQALQQGRAGLGLVDLWPLLSREPGGTNDQDSAEGGERIDYIFLSDPARERPALRPTAVRVNRFLDAKVISLSDHSALEADLEWLAGKQGR